MKRAHTNFSAKRCQGFTLVELLVVIAIMTVLLVMLVPSFRAISESNSLSGAAATVVSELDLARQTALAQAQEVQVRFLSLPDVKGTTDTLYRGVQMFQVGATVQDSHGHTDMVPLDKVQRLQSPVVILDGTGSNASFSSLFAGGTPATMYLPDGSAVKYQAVNYLAGGGTTLPAAGYNNGADTWFFTLKSQNAPLVGTTQPAKNFITIQIDPVTGRTRNFQP